MNSDRRGPALAIDQSETPSREKDGQGGSVFAMQLSVVRRTLAQKAAMPLDLDVAGSAAAGAQRTHASLRPRLCLDARLAACRQVPRRCAKWERQLVEAFFNGP